MAIRRKVRMSKPTLTIDSKHTVLDVNQITLTIDQLKVAMNNVYESSYTRVNEFHWYDLYSVSFSVSATLFISCLTTNFKDFSAKIPWLDPAGMTIIAWAILCLLFIFGMVCVCWKSHNTDDVFADRNSTVIHQIDKLQSNKEEVS